MSDAPESFQFFQVMSTEAANAFQFHKAISDNNQHIWPREEFEIQKYAEEGELFGIKNSSGTFVGLCYAHLDEDKWEIGGLAVRA